MTIPANRGQNPGRRRSDRSNAAPTKTPIGTVTALLVLFGAYHQTSGPSFVLTLPEAAWELSLGIYLIVKGFTPSHALYDDGRHTGVDGPLAPLLGAPERPAAP
jgi:hypothetical protein